MHTTEEHRDDARATWRMLEPYHGAVYFSPEAHAAYAELGVDPATGYFASRASAFGPAGAELVISTFYNFNPDLVHRALPAAWRAAPPQRFQEARVAAMDATLRRVLGDRIHSAEMLRAAELARQAALVTLPHPQGRPLFAAHAALGWPEEPHLVLWHAQTLLREFRGDGHLAALLSAGLDGIESLVTHAASGQIGAEALRTTRGWSPEQWNRAAERLRDRGWLTEGPKPELTAVGQEQREAVERATDELAVLPYAELGAAACAELRLLAKPFSLALAKELLPWAVGRLVADERRS
jgi:hypothetical protein